MRQRLAIVLNLILPGSGLIMLRREWLGAALAFLFGILGQVAVFGGLIVPTEVPRWLPLASLAAVVAVWGLAQWLLVKRLRLLNSPGFTRELREMRAAARAALDRGDHDEAHRTMLVAMSVDDEDVESITLWAELMSAMGREADARRGWRRVLALADGKHEQAAARRALASR